MYLFVVALHVVLCVFMILIIILQPGKGGDIGAAFGGGSSSSTVFGPRGPTGMLQKATTVVAVMFMCTSITLARYSNQAILANTNMEGAMRVLQAEEDEKALEAEEALADPVVNEAPQAPETPVESSVEDAPAVGADGLEME